MSFITSIGTAVPENKFEQSTIARFMEKIISDETERRKLHAVFRASGINTRYSVLDDYGKENDFSFYANTKNLDPFPSTLRRMEIYREHACALSLKAIRNGIDENKIKTVTHLITVSCTGMYAPGLDIDLVNALQLPTSTERICINFMGCYASINALKVADSICKSNADAKVLIVSTELCTIHFQKDFTEDNILANALFADGSSALLVEVKPTSSVNFSIEGFHSDIIKSENEHMAWSIGDLGFEMKLSSYVPEILQKGIHQLLQALFDKTKINLNQINHFAIHPGGKKIIETVAQELKLKDSNLNDSFQVLRDYGNMSSPTIIFVLNEIKKKLSLNNNDEFVMGLAFGPGLTMESMLLKIKSA